MKNNILDNPNSIHLDKLHLSINDNTTINFEPSHPIKLKLSANKDTTYIEVYEIQYYLNFKYTTVAYLRHRMRLKPHVSKIVVTNELLYNDWLAASRSILSKLNINENYTVCFLEIAIDSNVDLLKRYYTMSRNNQIELTNGYTSSVLISDTNNRFNGNIIGDTIYVQKPIKGKVRNQYNKTRIENKSNQLQTVNKPYINLYLSKVINTTLPIFRIEQIVNLSEYSKATRNQKYINIMREDEVLSKYNFNKLSEYDQCHYSKGISQIKYDSIRIKDLNDPEYLLILFNHFAKFNLSNFLGCGTIAPIIFNNRIEIIERTYTTTSIFGIDFFDDFNL